VDLSVLMPVFNREKYVLEAVNSILNQTHKDLQLLIYDDGSTDNTISILQGIKDSRIKLLGEQENKGVAYARNRLLEACDTPYACFQDSDDISVFNRLEKQWQIIKNNTVLVFCGWDTFSDTDAVDNFLKSNSRSRANATLMFPVDKEVKYNESLRMGGEDSGWIQEKEKKYDSVVVPEVLYHVRSHQDRIGVWKRKIRAKIPDKVQVNMSYREMIEYYKENFEGES